MCFKYFMISNLEGEVEIELGGVMRYHRIMAYWLYA